jgi:hypothetical protein
MGQLFAEVPTWLLIVLAIIAVILAIRFRLIVSSIIAAVITIGLVRAGDPDPWIGLVIGIIIYLLLGGFNGFDESSENATGGILNDEQARIEGDHQRRARESRF